MSRAIELDMGGRRRMRLSLIVIEDKDGAVIDRRILMAKTWADEPADVPAIGFSMEHVAEVVAALQRLAREAA
jgi:hypothetical protein